MTTPLAAEPTYTWENVLPAIGPPSKDELALFTIEASDAELADDGRRIQSKKILTDMLRWLGTLSDDLAQGGASTRALGFSPELLRVVAHEASTLRDRVISHEGQQRERAASREGNAGGAQDRRDRAFQVRDQLHAALRSAANGNKALLRALATAYGSAKEDGLLADALVAQEALARTWLEGGDNAGKRLAAGKVTPKMLGEVTALAVDLRAAGTQASGPRARAAVTQADLDVQDGRCLHHMDHLIEIFEAAHAADPRAPRLVPIATRSFFVHGKKAPAPAPVASPSPA